MWRGVISRKGVQVGRLRVVGVRSTEGVGWGWGRVWSGER